MEILPRVFHYSTGIADYSPEGGGRWGHGGVYAVRALDPLFDSLGKPFEIPGPLKIYSVDDEHNGSSVIWRGYGADASFNELLFAAAKETGYPPRPGVGQEEENQRIEVLAKKSDDPDFYNSPLARGRYWVHYGYELQERLREKLEAQGFDGIEVGGELVVWNYDNIGRAKLKRAAPASPFPIREPCP